MFHNEYSDKPTTTSKAINIALLIARPIIKPAAKPTASKQKRGQEAAETAIGLLKQNPGQPAKRAKKNWAAFGFYYVFSFFTRSR